MWKLFQSTQFKKDLKKIENQPEKVKALDAVLASLVDTGTVPPENKPHPLKGDLSGYMECHVQNDLLLIWYDSASEEIRLVRLGTHSELFKK